MIKDLPKIKNDLIKLLRAQSLAVLSTQQEGQPYASLVAFASNDDLTRLYFATTRSTRKFANIMKDSRVAMLIDNRSNNPADFQQAVCGADAEPAATLLSLVVFRRGRFRAGPAQHEQLGHLDQPDRQV